MAALFLCFLIPLLGAFPISIVGELKLGEPILILYFLFSLRKIAALFRIPVAQRIFILALLWLFSQVASDIYRGTPFADYSRGWAKIIMLLISYCACFTLVGINFNRAVAFAVGAALQTILNYLVFHPELQAYKFVFGNAISIGAFVLAAVIGGERRLWVIAIPIAAGALAFFEDARSLAGITVAAALYYLMLSLGLIHREGTHARQIFFWVVWASTAYSIIILYNSLGSEGMLSSSALDKYNAQTQKTGQFTLASGRGELYYSIPRILSSPIIGWGSWAKDINYVAQRAEELGANPAEAVASTGGLIPSHSHLLGAWLEAGLMGGLFWIYVLYLLAHAFASGWLSMAGRWSGVCSFIMVLFTWDILFSPFGGERRVNNGFYLWMVTLFVITAKSARFVRKNNYYPLPPHSAGHTGPRGVA